jgi:hypothetical protein
MHQYQDFPSSIRQVINDVQTSVHRLNRGPQMNDRLIDFFRLVGEQYVLDFSQAQQWLGRLSPEPDKMKQPGLLSAERTRKIIRRWVDEGILAYKVFYYRSKGVLWLTSKGLKYAELPYRSYEPSPSMLAHLSAVNDVRLFIAKRRPKDTWRSERELRAEQNAREKDGKQPHIVDAELIGTSGKVNALEVELTIKSEKRLESIIFDLAGNARYDTIWYFLPDHIFPVVKKAVGKLPRPNQKRFVFYSLKGEPFV